MGDLLRGVVIIISPQRTNESENEMKSIQALAKACRKNKVRADGFKSLAKKSGFSEMAILIALGTFYAKNKR